MPSSKPSTLQPEDRSTVVPEEDHTLTFEVTHAGGAELNDFSFTWDGNCQATWSLDISESTPDLSPASSAPIYGSVTWLNGRDLVFSYYSYDCDFDGCDRIEGAAPSRRDGAIDKALADPRTWAELGHALITAIYSEQMMPVAE